MSSRPPTDAVVEREFLALLEQYPTAPLVPVTENGLVADMPDSVPRKENPVLKGGSALDGVPVEDRACLIAAFDTLLKTGMAQCVLHPPGYEEVLWYGFDLRERHGVIVGVITADDDAAGAARVAAVEQHVDRRRIGDRQQLLVGAGLGRDERDPRVERR